MIFVIFDIITFIISLLPGGPAPPLYLT